MTVKNIKFTGPTTGTSSSSAGYVQGSATVGGQSTLLIADMTSRELLEGILIELKKMNLRDEAVTGETVNDGDILCS